MKYSGRVNVDLNGSWVAALVDKETQVVAGRARGLAPNRTGELAGSIHTSLRRNAGAQRDRVVGIVATNALAADGSGYGAADEFGTSRQRGTFFLRRALTG